MQGASPPLHWSPSRSAGARVASSSMLHIIGVPLLILASIGVGFVTVVLKEVLLPFVIALFLVYLLRPLVNVLTTPFAQWCWCVPSLAGAAMLPHSAPAALAKAHATPAPASGYASETSVGGDGAGQRGGHAPSPSSAPAHSARRDRWS